MPMRMVLGLAHVLALQHDHLDRRVDETGIPQPATKGRSRGVGGRVLDHAPDREGFARVPAQRVLPPDDINGRPVLVRA